MTDQDEQPPVLQERHSQWYLLALGLAVFVQTLWFGFIALDDAKHIWQNPYVSSLSLSNLEFFWREAYYGLYIPVTYNLWALLAEVSQSFFAPHKVTKFSALPFHGLNLILHLCNTWLIYQILSWWFVVSQSSREQASPEKGWLIALATLPFAVHPLQVEPVAWASGLKDVLMTTVCLGAVYYYCRSLTDDIFGGQSAKAKKGTKKKDASDKKALRKLLPWYFTFNSRLLHPVVTQALIVLHLGVAMLVKPAAVTVLVPIVAFHIFHFRKHWQTKAPALFAMVSVAAFLVLRTKKLQPTARLEFEYGFLERIQTALGSLGFYVSKLIWPFGLSPDYGLTPPRLSALPETLVYIAAGLFLVCALAIAFWKEKKLAFALTLLTGGLLPILGLVPFEYQNISTVADRYLYFVPMVGFGLVLSWFAEKYLDHLKTEVFIGLAVVMGLISFVQARHWRDNKALFTQVLAVNPKSPIAYNNLGLYALRSGDFNGAEKHLKRAISLKDKYIAAQSNLGVVYFQQKDFAKAVEYYTRVLSEYPEKTAGDPATFADMHFNLGAALVNTGKVNESVPHLKKAAEINVLHYKAHLQLGRVLTHLGRVEEAKRSLEMAYRLNPKDPALQTAINQIKSRQ